MDENMALLTGAGTEGRQPFAKRFLAARELAMLDILERCLPEYRFHAKIAMCALPNDQKAGHPAAQVGSAKVIAATVAPKSLYVELGDN